MAIFRYSMFMEESGFGWSENWYFVNASEDLFTARLQIGQIPQARATLLGATANMVGDRVALVEDNGGAKVTRVADPNDFFFPGAVGKPTVPIRTALLVRYRTADQRRQKLVYMGGAWKECNPFDDAYLVPNGSAFSTLLNSYFDKLVVAKLGWRIRGTKTERAIETYSVDAGTGIVSFTVKAPGMGFAELGKPVPIEVAFLGNVTPLDGVYDVTPTLQTEMKSVRPRPAKAGLTGGVMRRFDPSYAYLSTAFGQQARGFQTVERFVGRQRGKGSRVSRGRARAIQRF